MKCKECNSENLSDYYYACVGSDTTEIKKCMINTDTGELKRIDKYFIPRKGKKCDSCDKVHHQKELKKSNKKHNYCDQCGSCVGKVKSVTEEDNKVIIEANCKYCSETFNLVMYKTERSFLSLINDFFVELLY